MIGGILKGFGVTLKYFFTRPITVKYPTVRRETASGYRGIPALRRYPDGRERCVACSLCAAVCPARCITLTTDTGPDGRKRPLAYRLEVGRCLYCGLCAEVCPEEAVVLTRRYEMVVRERGGALLDKETLLDLGKGL